MEGQKKDEKVTERVVKISFSQLSLLFLQEFHYLSYVSPDLGQSNSPSVADSK